MVAKRTGIAVQPLAPEYSDPRAPSWRRSSLAGGGQAARGELWILSATTGGSKRRPARRCYWNSFRMSCAFWLAIDSDWMPSCSWVWSACNWVEAVFMSASTIPEMPSE